MRICRKWIDDVAEAGGADQSASVRAAADCLVAALRAVLGGATALLFVFFASPCLFAQSIPVTQPTKPNQPTLELPEMPSMPDMPTISDSGSFYVPTFPNQTGNRQSSKTDSDSQKSSNTKESVLSNPTSTSDVLSSLFGLSSNSTLTANDISSLYDSGLFSDISSLDLSTSANNYATTVQTNVLLQQVLNSLNELKTTQKNASTEEKNALENTKTDSRTFKNREPAILRFKINGYNITDSLTDVFFSELEPDGTFLLSADRKYYADQKTRTETFYLLFKTVNSKGSAISYKVQPSIVQDSKNTNSYVYKMAEVKNLTAEKTGNLVVLNFSSDNLTVDLLLDVDRK